MSEDTQVLTAVEATNLDDLELVIEKGLAGFVEVGQALQRIRDGRLYREGFATFEDYCRERWSLSRSYAYQVIDGAKIAGTLSAIADTPGPANEAVARELTPLKDEPEQVQQVWQETVQEHGPKPTAGQVREVVKRKAKPRAAKPAVPTKREVERLAYRVYERARALQRSLDQLAAAHEQKPINIPFIRPDLLTAYRAFGDLLARLAPASDEDFDGSKPSDGDLPEGWTLHELESLVASGMKDGEA
jgi:hypothetical protein